MLGRYNAWNLLRQAMSNHRDVRPAWRATLPKQHYEVIVIGGGGQGLATAYYLAKTHGITRVAVLEKGWIGGGNTGRNTTNVRSDTCFPKALRFMISRCICTRAYRATLTST